MITSSKVLIGLVTLFILMTITLNMYEGNEMTEGTDITELTSTNTTSTSVGENNNIMATVWNSFINSPVVNVGSGVVNWVNKYLLFDYTCFRDLNSAPVLQSDGTYQYPYNDFIIFRWLLVAVSVAIIVQLTISFLGQIGLFK